MPRLFVLGRYAHRVKDGGDLVVAESLLSEFPHPRDILKLSLVGLLFPLDPFLAIGSLLLGLNPLETNYPPLVASILRHLANLLIGCARYGEHAMVQV